MIFYWVDTTYACALMVTDYCGVVIHTAPIYRKYLGRAFSDVLNDLEIEDVLRGWEAF